MALGIILVGEMDTFHGSDHEDITYYRHDGRGGSGRKAQRTNFLGSAGQQAYVCLGS